jgi:hypothetical protein
LRYESDTLAFADREGYVLEEDPLSESFADVLYVE